jgi:hypothetical protein
MQHCKTEIFSVFREIQRIFAKMLDKQGENCYTEDIHSNGIAGVS